MPSETTRRRRMYRWDRYQRRCELLAHGQRLTTGLRHPVRTTPGYFRAEGWKTDARSVLRHGC